MIRTYDGLLPMSMLSHSVFGKAPSTVSFKTWVANRVNIEQLLGVSGFLAPPLYEVRGCLFWDISAAELLDSQEDWKTAYGSDPETVERYYNLFNLEEFFFRNEDVTMLSEERSAKDDSVEEVDLVQSFGQVLHYFWSLALRTRFPERVYRFEIAEDMFDEDGLCLTFWQDRSSTQKADESTS